MLSKTSLSFRAKREISQSALAEFLREILHFVLDDNRRQTESKDKLA
jgi:hypothetical protein